MSTRFISIVVAHLILCLNTAFAQSPQGAITTPIPGSTLSGSTVTFTWSAGTGASGYWLDVGTAEYGNTIYQSGTLSNTVFSQTVSGLPTNGSPVYVTLYTISGGTKVYNEYTYTAFNAQAGAAVMTYPTGTTLPGSSVGFTWSTVTGATYWLDVGTAEYGNTIYQSAESSTSQTVSGLPTNGSKVYATLYTIFSNGTKVYNEYTYTAFNASSVVPASITSPSSPSTLTANSVTFQWNAGTNVTSGYWLDVGSTVGGNQWYQSGNITTLSATAPNVPPNGNTVYVTLYSLAGGLKFHNSYTYTAANGAQMTSPTPGSTLSGASVTFTWSAGTGFTSYKLSVGSTYGGANIYPLTNLGDVTSTTVSGLPTNGSTVYVTLYSVNTDTGQSVQNYYSYVSGPVIVSNCSTPTAVGPYTFCSEAYNDVNSSTASVSLSPAAGNGVEIFTQWCTNSSCNAAPKQTATISDNVNSPETCFTASPHSPYDMANSTVPDYERFYVWYCPSIPAGVTSFTVTTSATANSLQIDAIEWKAGTIATSNYFENVDNLVSSGGTPSTTATVTTSGSTVNANDLITASIATCGATIPGIVGTGYTGIIVNPSSTPGHITEAKAVTSTGTQTATTTWTGTMSANACNFETAGSNDTWFGVIVPLVGASQ